MPWHVENDNPDCSGFAVVKDADGEIEGCHKTKADANAQMAALYASEEASMADATRPPRDGYRAISWPAEFREEADQPTRLIGHFARFNAPVEIDSAIEGRFIERIVPGAFARTLKNNADRIRVLFQHGKDPDVGEKPIAAPRELREDEVGPYYDAELLGGIPPLIINGLRERQYGVSYRFQVAREDWEPKPKKSRDNPLGLPERTIREARVFEFGPVTFPADAGADVMVRSLSDQMSLRDLAADPAHLRDLVNSIDPDALPAGPEAEPHSEPETRETVAPPTPQPPERKITLDQYVTREEKASRVTDLKAALARQAVEYPGVLPADAQATWDADSAELEALERDIAAWDSRQARLAEYAADESKRVEYQAPTFNVVRKLDDIYDLSVIRSAGSEEKRDQMLRDNAMRAVETTSIPHPKADQDGGKAAVANLLDYGDSPDKELAHRIIATGSPGYRKAFNRYFTTGRMEERYAAVTTGGTTTGGYATPWMMDPSLIAIGAHTSTNPYRAACRVVQLVGTNKWEAVTATAVLSAYAGEAVAPAEGGPTFGQPTYECLKASSFVTLSIEIAEDRPDMASEIAVLIQESKDTLEEEKFSIGAGTTVPWGVALLAEYTTTKTAGAGVVAIGDLYLLEAALPIRHRANAAWFMSRGTIRAVQGFETSGGILFGQPFATVGTPARNATGNTGLSLLGYPVWEAPSISSTLTTPDTNPIVFCDPSSYIIVDRVGLNIEVIPHIFEHAAGSRPMGQRGVYGYWRNTARRVNVDAGRILVIE